MKTVEIQRGGKNWVICRFLTVLIGVAMLTGCGGGGAPSATQGMSEDEKAISNLVSSIADYAMSTERLRALFTKDGAPTGSEAGKFKNFAFYVSGDITVNGTTASFPVTCETPDDPPVQTQQTWTATKEGESWLLSAAPLP